MKKCRTCQNERTYSQKPHKKYHKITTEYGLPLIVQPQNIVIYQDEHLLKFIIKSQRNTRRLDKSVHKLEKQMGKLRKSVQNCRKITYQKQMEREEKKEIYGRWRNKQDRNEDNDDFHIGSIVRNYTQSLQNTGRSIRNRKQSKPSSVNTSKNRQIGRFTRVSQGQSLSLKQLQPEHNSFVYQSIIRKPSVFQQHYSKRQQLQQLCGRSCDQEESSCNRGVETISFSKYNNGHFQGAGNGSGHGKRYDDNAETWKFGSQEKQNYSKKQDKIKFNNHNFKTNRVNQDIVINETKKNSNKTKIKVKQKQSQKQKQRQKQKMKQKQKEKEKETNLYNSKNKNKNNSINNAHKNISNSKSKSINNNSPNIQKYLPPFNPQLSPKQPTSPFYPSYPSYPQQSSQNSYLFQSKQSKQIPSSSAPPYPYPYPYSNQPNIQKAQLQRQFEQLIILQKRAGNNGNIQEKKIIREEIRQLANMLAKFK